MLAAGGAQTTKVKGVIQQLHHALDVTTPQLSRTLVSPDVVVLENGAGFMNRLHRWICRSGVWKKALQNEMLPWALKDVDLGRNLLEVGPGPGLTTDCLRTRFDRITALEVDTALADLLTQRLSGTNVTVIQGDASAMPFEDGTFSGAVAFTMLHHVPSPTLQDRLLSEVYRVLKPGGVFGGTDSVWSPGHPHVPEEERNSALFRN